jgi:HPt (histidine-containing phosphotransfer) domain-containing protein
VSDALTSSAAAAEHRPAIDPATFAALVEMTGGEMDFVDELVDTFLEDGAAQVAALEAAIGAGGAPESLVRPAHSLKSSSLNVGALGLGELSRNLEEAARSGPVADPARQLDAIGTAFADVRRELLAERARRTPV